MERTGRIADAPAGATPRGAGVPDLSHLEPAHRDRLAARHGAAVASMTPFSRLPGERGTFDAGGELFPRKDPPVTDGSPMPGTLMAAEGAAKGVISAT
jgi:hypothetical protein